MENNEKSSKTIRYIATLLLYLLVFWFTQTLIDINRPARVSMRKVDAIQIMGTSPNIFVHDQEKINRFKEQMRYKFVIPSFHKQSPINEEYYVLVFYKNNKVVSIFACNTEKRLLEPRGTPLSSDLYDIIESFIKDSYQTN